MVFYWLEELSWSENLDVLVYKARQRRLMTVSGTDVIIIIEYAF